MKSRFLVLIVAASAIAGSVSAQTSNPNPKNFKLIIDGGEAPGIAGFPSAEV